MRDDLRIVNAAVRYDGRVYEGERHGQIMQAIWAARGNVKITQEDQGFTDNCGAFWNRFQAGAIAYRAGQTKIRKRHLLSEDLW